MSELSTSKKRRKPKEKLSTLDELMGDGAGEIIFQPQLSDVEIDEINKKTRLADIPFAARTNIENKTELPLNEPGSFVRDAETPPTQCIGNSKIEDLRASPEIRAQLEHKKSTIRAQEIDASVVKDSNIDQSTSPRIRAQLEHNDETPANLIGAQLEHSERVVDFTIGAQLEHKDIFHFPSNAPTSPNKSTIRAQNPRESSPNKSTIGVQLSSKDTLDGDLIGAQLEHNLPEEYHQPAPHFEDAKPTSTKQIRVQLEHNDETSTKVTLNKSTIRAQSPANKSTHRSTTDQIIGAQLEHKIGRLDFESLVGKELAFVQIVFKDCVSNGSLVSSKFSNHFIAQLLSVQPNTLKTIVKRVVDKGFLSRSDGKRGRGGYLQFAISEDLYRKMLVSFGGFHRENYKSTIGGQLEDNWSTNRSTEKSTEPPSKLVSNINNLLTKNEGGRPNFSTIDISGLHRFGITEKQLRDFENQKLSFPLEQLEDFVWKFEQYASNANNIKGVRSVVGLFCKMAQSLASGVDPLSHIKTPEEMALENALAASQRALAERGRVEGELKQNRFLDWFNALDESERNKLAPPTSLITSGSELQKKQLSGYFSENIWPELKNQILGRSL